MLKQVQHDNGRFFPRFQRSPFALLTPSVCNIQLPMEFKTAPLDAPGRIITAFVITLMLVMSYLFYLKTLHGSLFVVLFLSIPLISFLLAPKKYHLNANSIIIEKVIGKKMILPLRSVQACVSIPDASKLKLIRTFGNGGLFAYYGLFSSRKYGTINFQVTRLRNILLIKTEQGIYGISPAAPEAFIERLNALCPAINHELEPLEEPMPQLAILIVPVSILIVTVIAGLVLHDRLPDQIAVHFDLHGNPDRWAPRSTYLLANFMPVGIVFALNILLFFLTRRRVRNPRAVNTMVITLSLIQLLILYVMIDMYVFNTSSVHVLPMGTVMIMFAVIMFFLGFMYYRELKK